MALARFGTAALARWLGRDRPAALPPAEIAVGDRFFEANPPHAVWTVDRFLATPACDIPHVIISRDGLAPTTKIISTAVLNDPRFYRRDRRDPDSGEDNGQRRRKHDLPLA
ncbi:MAG: hypothetical protein D6782_01495 [Alphaproteobacteria bacterium]|nr:MAG: hypothetical protein D6782_01495 [Alphaproteobacteria bacterium]